jgi:nucleoside-diphosphate-sugar epimerase
VQAGAWEAVIWGTGTPRREFLHMDDMAAASLFVLDLPKETYDRETDPMLSHINVGSGTDVTILELAQMVAGAVGYAGDITTDPSKPDGTPRKLMDVSRLERLGWTASMTLAQGIAETDRWFLDSAETFRKK